MSEESKSVKKAIVLSSGGVDSTTALGLAINDLGAENVVSISVTYGQRHSKELKCAKEIAEYYNIQHYELDASNIFEFSNCPLLQHSTEAIPEKSYAEQIAENGEGKVATYVPFRNGLMMSIAATIAQSMFPNDECYIYIGAHADDAAGDAYADCSNAFTDAMNSAINIGTYNLVSVKDPFVSMNKAEVVATGLKIGVPYQLTYSCYEGGDEPCGKCGTCIDRAAAFSANGIEDPAIAKLRMEKIAKEAVEASLNSLSDDGTPPNTSTSDDDPVTL